MAWEHRKHDCRKSRCGKRLPTEKEIAIHLVWAIRLETIKVIDRLRRDDITATYFHGVDEGRAESIQKHTQSSWDPKVVDFSNPNGWKILIEQLRWTWRILKKELGDAQDRSR